MNIDNSLIIEINGTSTNLISIRNNAIIDYKILPFGGINLAFTFDLHDRISNSNLDKSIEFLKNTFNDINLLNNKFESIILIGEFAKTIVKMDKFRTHYPLQLFNNYELSTVGIRELYNIIKELNK